MEPRIVWMLIAIAAVAVVITAWVVRQRRQRSAHLRQRFGPEYDRVVRDTGIVDKAEARLAAREKHVAALHIRPLSRDARDQYVQEWDRVQTRFVDEPDGAVRDADRLVGEVMHDR